ncbi:MAG: dephospho-CoA kinase [Gammaproteobacteria bacterium]
MPKTNTPKSQKVKPLCIGLTGGLASGKSLVAGLFAAKGAEVVDADEICRDLTMPGQAAVFAVRRALGAWAADNNGVMNRDDIRRRIFADERQKAKLEAVLHPRIRREMKRRIAKSRAPYIIAVVPLLFETGIMLEIMRRVAVVDCSRRMQEKRAKKRNTGGGWDSKQIAAILAAQMTRAERLARADDIIKNSTDDAPPDARVFALHQTYKEMQR